jgi:hypothetical protein
MSEHDELAAFIDQLDEDDIAHARRMTGEQKLRDGAELFDYACSITLAGIKHQHPDWTHEQAWEELRRRVYVDDGSDE